MKERIAKLIKGRLALLIATGLLAAIILGGIPFAVTHNQLFSLSNAHASTPNPIQVENSLPGTPGWNDFASDLSPTTLSGFGSQISVNHGDKLSLYITTTAPSFTIDIFRTGYYGGVGAREITSLGSFPGLAQPIPTPDPVTGMISCTGWTASTSITIPSTWVTGVYLAKLTGTTKGTTDSSYIFFVVRDDGGSEDILFQASVTTYQAYNTWGGTSLYNNDLTNKALYPYPHATKVSFDRPFNPGDSDGAGHYLFYEYKFVYWMEQQGYNVAYTTDVDTDARSSQLLNHKAFLSVGHDEYWSMGMRNAVENAISAGVNVAFFSANVMYWQIRFEPNSAGVADRVEVGYKDFATFNVAPGPDPLWNVNNSLVTTNWRDPVVNMPENGLGGVMFEQQEDADYAYVVENASSWIYANTGFIDGSTVPGIVGYEYDRVWNNGFSPSNLSVLSSSPVHGCCGGYSSFSNSTLYTAPSGARVFSAGTIQWSLGLANVESNTYMNAGIQKTTANILNNFIGLNPAPTSSVSLSTEDLSFGNVGISHTGAPQPVKLTNTSSSALTISSISVTGTNATDFVQTNNCPSSLAAGANCTITISFHPTVAGTRSATVSIADSSPGGSQDIALTGTGIGSGAAANLSASQLNFGNQTIHTTSPAQTFTLTNTGTATLSISYIQTQGLNNNDFAESDNCSTSLAVNASCTVTVSFTPAATSTRSGSITVADNASDSPETVVLSGTGVAANPGLALSPQNLSFGTEDEGEVSNAQTVTLTNNTTSAVSISAITVIGTNSSDFSQTNTCPVASGTLAVNASCTLSVTFTPQDNDLGSRTASISITDNGPNSPQTITLNGTAVEDDGSGVALSPGSLSFGNQNNNTSSAAQSLTVTSNGRVPLLISSITVTGTNPGDFSESDNCPQTPNGLAVNATCTIQVIFKPTVSGARNATISVLDNTDGEGEAIQTVALSGTGVDPTANLYFNDGFESGNLSQWTSGSSGTGTAAVQTTTVNGGAHAAALTDTAGQTEQIATNIDAGAAPSPAYTRFYFNYSSLSGTTLIAMGQDSSSHSIWIMYYDSGRQGLDIYFWNAAGARYDIYSNMNVLAPNTWYNIEVEANEATNGGGGVWLNGTSIGSFSGDLSEASGYSQLILTNQATGTTYFDDVAVANNFTIPSTSSGISLSASSLNFPNQVLGTTSGAKTVTLTNTGTSALTISGISVTGTNASDFTQTNNCATSLAISSTCTINVSFSPGANGSRTASVNIADNAPGGSQSIALSGTGAATAPVLSLSSASLAFGSQTVGTSSTSQTITLTSGGSTALTLNSITITGSNAGDFTRTTTCGSSLAVGASCAVTVTFTPTASGSRSASVTISDDAPDSPQNVTLSGTAAGSNATIYFNDGFESGSFNQWTGGTSGTGSATVQQTTVNSGNDAAALTNAAGQTTQVSTSINGGVAPTLAYSRFSFDLASVTTTTLIALAQDSSGHNIWIMYYDSGRQGLDIYFWNGAGTRYDIYSNAGTLTANTWYTVEVEANQTTTGGGQAWLNGTSIDSFSGDLSETSGYSQLTLTNQSTGTIDFDDAAVANAQTIPSVVASISLSTNTLSFANQALGTTSSARAVTVTNPGAIALAISSIAVSGTNASDFAQTNNCPASLAASSTCTINVTFAPAANGSRAASVHMTDNAPGSPQSIALSGTGGTASPAVTLSTSSLSFGNQTTGVASTAQSVTVTNSGSATLTLTNLAVTGTNASDFTQITTCGSSLAAGGNCTVSVTFTPAASGARSASLSLTDNASNSPQGVTLSGTGTTNTSTAYFNDGFESGSLNQWTGGASGTGSATVQQTTIHSGTRAAALTNTAGQSIQIATNIEGGSAPIVAYTRFSFNLASVTSTTLIALAQDASGHNIWIMYYDSGRQGLDTYFWNSAGTRYDIYTNTNVLSANTWYTIEVGINQASSGSGQIWLNGTSVDSFTGNLVESTGYSQLTLTNQSTGTIDFDDARVSNAYNGLTAFLQHTSHQAVLSFQQGGLSADLFALLYRRRSLV